MDAVQHSKSGHPGAPMGMADIATVLFKDFMQFDAAAAWTRQVNSNSRSWDGRWQNLPARWIEQRHSFAERSCGVEKTPFVPRGVRLATSAAQIECCQLASASANYWRSTMRPSEIFSSESLFSVSNLQRTTHRSSLLGC
jgi:hypothetical protein